MSFKLTRLAKNCRDIAGKCKNRFDKKENNSNSMKKWVFNSSGFNKLGLYTNDILNEGHPIVKHALNRLPKDVIDARTFRIIRAMQMDYLKVELPKEKWITFEEDQRNRYLDPYIEEVMNEKLEIREFGCTNYGDYDF